MAVTPNYASAPRTGVAALSAAETNRVTPVAGNTPVVLAGGANGTRIDRVVVQATATTTQGMVRLFLHDGTTFWLLQEIPVAAATPSATVQAFNVSVAFDGGVLLPNSTWSLRAATNNAEAFRVMAFGGDF